MTAEPSGRKTRFGADYRDQAEVAAEVAKDALERFQRFDADRVEIEGLLNGARNLVDHAQSTVYANAEECRAMVAEAQARNEVANQRIRDVVDELERRYSSMLSLEDDVRALLKDAQEAAQEAKESVFRGRHELNNEAGRLIHELTNQRRQPNDKRNDATDGPGRKP
jgi:hypothetical protein